MKCFFKVILISIGMVYCQFSFSHESDTISSVNNRSIEPFYFNLDITVTTKGIATLPNLSLGKPAMYFDMKIGRNKLSFEPRFRFALTGKPWIFQFWWRYKAIESEKFRLNVGARPGFNFKTKAVTIDNVTSDEITVLRNLGGEFIPTYNITKNISLNTHYLYLYGLNKNMSKHTNFIALRTNISNIPISKDVSLRLSPQIYYLRMDTRDGVYYGSSLSLIKKDFPLSLSSLFNKELKSNLAGNHDFLWNISLIYSLNKQFVVQ